MERIYAVIHQTRKEAYIGRTHQALADRWAQHLRCAAAGVDKRLYEAIRFEPLAFDIMLCEESPTASEAKWTAIFEDEGYALLNQIGGNAKAPKPRDVQQERQTATLLSGATPYVQPVMDPVVAAANREKQAIRAREMAAVIIAGLQPRATQ